MTSCCLLRVPDVRQGPGAFEVDPGLGLVAGGLACVRVGGHAVETDLVAPGSERTQRRVSRATRAAAACGGRWREPTHFLSSLLVVGWRISIKAPPNFYGRNRASLFYPTRQACAHWTYGTDTSPFSGGSPLPNVLVTTNTSVSCSRSTTSYSSMDMT